MIGIMIKRFSLATVIAPLALAALCPTALMANTVETVQQLTSSRTLTGATDLHITATANAIASGVTLNIVSDDAWVFFDNVKPNEVVKTYASGLRINGVPFDAATNGRVAIYKQGAVVMAHGEGYGALTTYTGRSFSGERETFTIDRYYSNKPDTMVPADMVSTLEQDNKIRSFRLKRGYMATMADEADGMGYSRVFIADEADLEMSVMPHLLDGKVSFVRVCKWQYPSKKGWVGSVWKTAPEGLKYVAEQSDFTNSTWYYNWSCTTGWSTNPNTKTTNYNQEFVPEKWGAGGLWKEAYSIRDVSHLLGYNEPDHSEQSNVSVAKAIGEWPMMQKTGLRLGAPATTNFSWLYEFMNKARQLNYRVDYVPIHAYWGGMSGNEWYAALKAIHDRTGCPLWITEWNNGANWTKEGWPTGTAEQQAKQLADLKDILTVMDTASFVERYSIYNWVEDKRAIILSGKLTPAGEYYAADEPDYFFIRQGEVLPTWTVREAPVLRYSAYSPEKGVTLAWTDCNGEQIDRYVVEHSGNGTEFSTLDTLDMPVNSYTDNPDFSAGNVYYRLTSIPLSGSVKTSNVTMVNSIANKGDEPVSGSLLIDEHWALAKLQQPFSKAPVCLLGVPTYRNKLPLSCRVRNLLPDAFELRLGAWDYQLNPALANPDTIAFLALPEGTYTYGDITVEAAHVEGAGTQWQHVTFARPFGAVPVVIPTQNTDRLASASSPRIRNVSTTGFDIALQYEGAKAGMALSSSELVSYVALTPGMAVLGDKILKVGLTPPNAVGDNASGGYRVDFGDSYSNAIFFGAMQTAADTVTSTLRIKTRSDSGVTLIKDREKSSGYAAPLAETVGWCLVASSAAMGIGERFPDDADIVVRNKMLVTSDGQPAACISVFDLHGTLVAESHRVAKLDMSRVAAGVYVVKVDGRRGIKIVN